MPETPKRPDVQKAPEVAKAQDPTKKPDTPKGADPAKKPDPPKGPDSAKRQSTPKNPETTKGTDPAKKPDAQKGPEPAKKPDAQKGPEPAKKPDAQKGPEPAKKPDAQKGPEPAKQPDAQKAPDPTKKPDTPKNPETAKGADAKKADASKTPETPKGTDTGKRPSTPKNAEASKSADTAPRSSTPKPTTPKRPSTPRRSDAAKRPSTPKQPNTPKRPTTPARCFAVLRPGSPKKANAPMPECLQNPPLSGRHSDVPRKSDALVKPDICDREPEPELPLEPRFSCEGFPADSSTSSDIGIPCKVPAAATRETVDSESKCSDSKVFLSTSSSSSSSTVLTQVFKSDCRFKTSLRKPPNIAYELACAKALMQQYSTLSGDNLFDHLSDIIKRVIDERPPNVIDFFEEFSRNVREQKFHLPERFPPESIYEETRLYRVSKRLLMSMKLPYTDEHEDIADEMSAEDVKSSNIDDLALEIDTDRRFITFNERVQQMQFFWNQCGFSISSDDIFQLACAMNRLHTHPSILECRFWGVINGLKASYYIVEASLTREEINSRLEQMQKEMRQKLPNMLEEKNAPDKPQKLEAHIGPELTPGINGWENYPQEDLAKMQPPAAPVPLIEVVEVFDVPPEIIGLGLNRFSYFVINTFSDDWIELPIVTPKQIIICRNIKKFFTGDLEAEVASYPCFPGKEKHYLRATIARITAGTYIAPEGYYRRITKREQRQYDGFDDDEMEEEGEEEEDLMGEDEELDNDVLLLKDEKYTPLPVHSLAPLANWLHVRPNILKQGRVVWYDEVKAKKERDRELARLLKLRLQEEMGEEEVEEEEGEDEDEGEEEGMIEALPQPEIGPPLLNPINNDISEEFTVPWIVRFTSRFTIKNERIIVLRSNVWPGAYTFAFEKTCESIYMGWGHKYTARNMTFYHIPQILDEYPHTDQDYIETTDPSVAEEEAYRLYLLRKNRKPDDFGEEMEDFEDNDLSHESDDD